MATPFAPLKFLLPSLNLLTPKTLLVMRKFPHFLHIIEISAILAYFCPNFIAMATPFAPQKFQIAYLNSPTPKTLLFMRKIPQFLSQNYNYSKNRKKYQWTQVRTRAWLPSVLILRGLWYVCRHAYDNAGCIIAVVFESSFKVLECGFQHRVRTEDRCPAEIS